jgi:hypothetical protein
LSDSVISCERSTTSFRKFVTTLRTPPIGSEKKS